MLGRIRILAVLLASTWVFAPAAEAASWLEKNFALFGPRFRVSGLRAGFAADGLDPQEDQLREGMRPGDPGFGEAPGLEPGRYFRLLLIGCFEGIDSERGIAGAAPTPLSVRSFVGYALDEASTDHSMISRTGA